MQAAVGAFSGADGSCLCFPSWDCCMTVCRHAIFGGRIGDVGRGVSRMTTNSSLTL